MRTNAYTDEKIDKLSRCNKHKFVNLPKIRSTSRGKAKPRRTNVATSIANSALYCGGGQQTGSNAGITNHVGYSYSGSGDYVYQFNAPIAGTYTFDTCGSYYDTWVYVYRVPSLPLFCSLSPTSLPPHPPYPCPRPSPLPDPTLEPPPPPPTGARFEQPDIQL